MRLLGEVPHGQLERSTLQRVRRAGQPVPGKLAPGLFQGVHDTEALPSQRHFITGGRAPPIEGTEPVPQHPVPHLGQKRAGAERDQHLDRPW